MSDEISAAPTPWKVADQYVMRDARDIRDATGALVAVGVSSVGARLIVDAVNWYCDWGALSAELERLRAERDRLRDIVRTVYNTIELQATFDDEGGFHLDNVPACVIAEALFRDDELHLRRISPCARLSPRTDRKP